MISSERGASVFPTSPGSSIRPCSRGSMGHLWDESGRVDENEGVQGCLPKPLGVGTAGHPFQHPAWGPGPELHHRPCREGHSLSARTFPHGGGGANVFMGPNPARGPAAESSQGWGHPARTGPPGQRVRGQAGPGRAVSENTQAAGRRAQGSPQPQLCFNFISLTSMQDRWLAACKVPPFAYLQEARWGGRAGAGEGGRAPS